jgi:hypothetical protein
MATLGEITARINEYVAKYMTMLGIKGEPPIVKIRSNLGSTWLGRTSWTSARPHTTTIELQQSIIGDAPTLERVIAHEMIHHRDSIAISESDLRMIKLGIKPDSHGAAFREGAARINEIMGPGFVTKESDKEYKKTAPTKAFLLLITPLPGGRIGWNWAARLGPKATDWVAELVSKGSRLVNTSDERWTRGAKIVRYGGYSIPKSGSEDAAALRALFDGA